MKRSLYLVVLTVLAALLSSLMTTASAADPAPTVVITTDPADPVTYTAGQTATVNFTVDNVGPGTRLKVVIVGSNGVSKTLHDTDVSGNEQGRSITRMSLAMYINARIYAYVGGSTTPGDTRAFPVKAAVGTRPRGGYLGFIGSYAIFPKGASPVFRSTTLPKRPGVRCLRHEVQKLAAAGWTTVLRGSCRVQNSSGNVDWQWAGKHGSNVKFRVRATFPGDSWNQPSSAPYSYFKFK